MILGIFEYGGYYINEGNWMTDLVVAIAGASIGSGVTVWALYETFRKDKQKEEDRRLQFQTEKLKYFQSLIDSVLKGLKTQSDFYKNFSDELRQDSFNIPLMKYVPFNELTRMVQKLNLEDYYHAYLGEFGDKKEIITEFKQIITCLDYFSSQIELYKDSLVKSVDFDFQRKIKFKSIAENGMDDMSKMIIDNNMKNHSDFLEFLKNTFITFNSNSPEVYNLKYLHDNFILGVQAPLFQYAETIPEATFILIQMKNASVKFNEIPLQNLNLASDFESLHNTFNEKIIDFEGFINRILKYNS